MPATVVASTDACTFSGTDATIPAISGYTPQLGDTVYLFGNINSQTVNVITPADWSYGPTPAYGQSATNMAFVMAHNITQAEVTAGTNSWTVGMFDAGAAGRGPAVVVRGAELSALTDVNKIKVNTSASTMAFDTTATPTVDGDLVFAFAAPDNLGQAITMSGSTGWTQILKRHNVAGVTSFVLLQRNALASAGVAIDVGSFTLTLGSSDESVTIVTAVKPPASSGGFFAVM